MAFKAIKNIGWEILPLINLPDGKIIVPTWELHPQPQALKMDLRPLRHPRGRQI